MDGWPEGVDSLIGNSPCGCEETMFECDESQTVTCLLCRRTVLPAKLSVDAHNTLPRAGLSTNGIQAPTRSRSNSGR